MKFKHLILGCGLALTMPAIAAPAYPGIIRIPGANGEYTEIRKFGDEHFSYTTDAEGKTLLQLNNKGEWEAMTRGGVELTATAANIEMLRSEKSLKEESVNNMQKAPQRMPLLDDKGRTNFPTLTEEMHMLVILLEYKDVKFETANPKEEFNNYLNQEGYNGHGAIGSVADYFEASSNGKFRPVFDIEGIIELPETSGYYVGGDKYARVNEMLRYAVEELDRQGFDFSKYDYDKNGEIDNIYFIYAGYGQADTGKEDAIWPHQSVMPSMILDGLRTGAYACSSELNGGMHYYWEDKAINGTGTFCHEFSHVLGLPDFYDPNYGTRTITPGKYSIMDQGSYNGDGYIPLLYSAYERWACHWVEFTDAENEQHYELKPIDQPDAIAVRLPVLRESTGVPYDNEYFIAESRSKKFSQWDATIPGEGMIIWHINYKPTLWAYNRVNSTALQPCVSILSSDGSAYPFTATTGGTPTNYAPWPGNAKIPSIYPGSLPVSFDTWAAGAKNANIFVTDIAFDDETGIASFDYNKVKEVPSGKTTMNEAKRLRNDFGNVTNTVRLNWEKDPNAESYMLTVYRINSSGKAFFEQGLEETNVGNNTSYDLEGLSDTKMDLTYYAYVRSVYKIPSKEKSNEIEFVGNNLEIVSGVENITDGEIMPIIGGKGYITAPEGAEIYTIGGVKTMRNNLAPGVYLVRYGQKVTKVIVK